MEGIQTMQSFFWKNVAKIKEVLLLSLSEMADDISRFAPESGMTKGKLNYYIYKVGSEPSAMLLDAVNTLYCRGLGCNGDSLDISRNDLDADGIVLLTTDILTAGCSIDKDAWTRNFWSNYRWIEVCYQQIGRSVPGWKNAGHYTYTLRKNRNILPPRKVLEEFADSLGYSHFCQILLHPFSGSQMLWTYAGITMPNIDQTDSMGELDNLGRLAIASSQLRMLLSTGLVHLDEDVRQGVDEATRRIATVLEKMLKDLAPTMETAWRKG